MLLQDNCKIGEVDHPAPFEGDLTLWLRDLPAGARATKATIQLEPIPFQEPIDLTVQPPILGVTTVSGVSGTTSFVEVNFHARRTLVSVEGSGGSATLQVDMGGTFVSIADDGSIFAPNKNELKIPFSTASKQSLPGLTVSKFRLSLASGTLTVNKVTISSVPSNVSVRIGQLPAFWTHLGELAVADTSPDFALALNTFLTTAQPQNGFYAIAFVIHSDTLAQLNATLQIEYVIDQPVLPSYLPEITMSYAFNPQPDIDTSLTTVKLPKSAVPVAASTNARVRGEFQPTRVAQKAVGESPIVANVVVSPTSSLAQPFRLDNDIALTGIDLPLSKALPGLAGLNIAIQADNDGKPSGQVLVQADLDVGKPLPDQSVWGSATLPAPFPLAKQGPNQAPNQSQVYWLILESLVGQVFWIATPGVDSDLVLQYSSDNGLSWRPANAQEELAPLSAQFRLRNVPNHFTIPIQLDIGQKPGDVLRRLDEFASLGRVEMTFGFGDALGQHLANLTAASPSPCGSENLVINGDFSDPPPDDAAMKLFGIEYKQGRDSFTPTVTLGPRTDLSAQRFVTLSYDVSPPQIQPTRIDCAGANPAQTAPDEIVNAINKAIGQTVISFTLGSLTFVDDSVVLYPWCEKQIPSGWQGTANQTYRLKIPDGSNRTVVLLADPASLDQFEPPLMLDQWDISYACFPLGVPTGSTTATGEASLSQRIPVAAGCSYQLEIGFLFKQFDLPDIDTSIVPGWEVTWLDSHSKVVNIDTEMFNQRLTDDESNTQLSHVDALLTAPPNAVNADLRFINSASDAFALVIEMVSFTPKQQALRNGNFLQWADIAPIGSPAGQSTGRSPAGWMLKSGVLGSESEQAEVKLLGNGPDDTVLSQLVDVIAGDAYELQVCARQAPPVKGDPGMLPTPLRSRLELQWLSNGQPGDVAILPLDGRNFSGSAWAGVVPNGVTQAEIRLIQPRGANNKTNNLLVESVVLEKIELVQVPLVFLSEAPGQLTISQMHVAYDIPKAQKPPRRVSIAASSGSTKTAIALVPAVSNGNAGGTMMPTPQLQPQPATIPVTGTAAVTTQVPQAPQPPQAPAASMLPLTSIPGIGEARARQLQAVGIDSLEKLASAAPEDIVQALKGVKQELATDFIKEAQQLIEPPSPGTISN
jgi:hypothetical protein